MTARTIHVVHNPNGGWDVKRGGNPNALGHFDRKSEAINWGRFQSQLVGGEFLIHGMDGKIQEKDSHGHDPFPPMG